jgi:mannitol-1-phosphate 5-dehydrogenase
MEGVEKGARAAMMEGCAALAEAYPHAYSTRELEAHVEDLILRFRNTALGDTVHRVGRDLYRKLDREDRLAGAMRLCARQGKPFVAIAAAYHAAIEFAAPDENGKLFPDDERFRAEEKPKGLGHVLRNISHLDSLDPVDARVIAALENR